MKARTFWTVSVVTINMAFVITACGGASPPTSVSETAVANTPEPTLTFTPAPSDTPEPSATMTPTAPGGFPAGVYKPEQKLDADRLSFHADGTYLITLGPRGIPGHYTVDGNKILLSEDSGVCLNHPGTFNWEVQANVLTLKAIDDTCTGSARGKDLSRAWDLLP